MTIRYTMTNTVGVHFRRTVIALVEHSKLPLSGVAFNDWSAGSNPEEAEADLGCVWAHGPPRSLQTFYEHLKQWEADLAEGKIPPLWE